VQFVPGAWIRRPQHEDRGAGHTAEGRVDYLLVKSTGISEPLPVAEPRLGPADGPHLPALFSCAEELITAIGFEAETRTPGGISSL